LTKHRLNTGAKQKNAALNVIIRKILHFFFRNGIGRIRQKPGETATFKNGIGDMMKIGAAKNAGSRKKNVRFLIPCRAVHGFHAILLGYID
jgi:hypothetical protein